MTVIRTAAPGDLPAVAALAARTFPLACPSWLSDDRVNDFIATELSEDAFAGHLADPDHHVLVALDDAGRVVGYTLALHGRHPAAPQDWSAERTVYLSKVYVAPEQHGGGIAAQLVAAVRAAAAADGCTAVWLGTNRENGRAKRFYLKSGFTVVGERHFDVGGTLCADDVFGLRLTG